MRARYRRPALAPPPPPTSCPRCAGNILRFEDEDGPHPQCLQCSWYPRITPQEAGIDVEGRGLVRDARTRTWRKTRRQPNHAGVVL